MIKKIKKILVTCFLLEIAVNKFVFIYDCDVHFVIINLCIHIGNDFDRIFWSLGPPESDTESMQCKK